MRLLTSPLLCCALQQLGFCQLIAFKAQLTQGILKELLQAESDFATHLRACDLSPLLSRLHLQCVRGTASATLEGQAVRLLQQSWLPVEWARMDACAFGAGSCGTSNADILLRMLAGGQAVPNVVTGPAKALRPQGSAVQPAISATGTGISTVGGSTSTAVPSPSCHASTHESPAKAALAAMTAAAAAVPRASSTGVSLSYESMLAAQASSYHSSTVAAAGTRLTRHFAQVRGCVMSMSLNCSCSCLFLHQEGVWQRQLRCWQIHAILSGNKMVDAHYASWA